MNSPISLKLRHVTGRRRRRALAAGTAALTAAALTAALSSAAIAPQAGQRVDMKVLLLAPTAADADATAWEDSLKREGTPYTRINANGAGSLSAATFATGDHANYQAVITAGANGTAAGGVSTDGANAFSTAEWDALRAFETKFSIRQLDVNAYPGASIGTAGLQSSGALDGGSATVTAAGKTQFPNLQGAVDFANLDDSVSEVFAAAATAGGCNAADSACAATSSTPLVTGSTGAFSGLPLVTLVNMKDGREEMVATLSGNQFQLHTQILRHAFLSWVTGGVYIGTDHSYFSMDVDDVFLPDTKWDPITNTTPGDGSAVTPNQPAETNLRMLAADVTKLVAFQNSKGVKLNMTFNGAGVGEFQDDPANPAPGVDGLFNAFKANKAQFPWINHTWAHPSLGSPNPENVSQAEIQSQISLNRAFAQGAGADQLGLPAANYSPAELVTGEHSGIGTSKVANSPTGPVPISAPEPGMPAALNAEGVTTVGADNSREAGQRRVGNAYTLPRYPMNVFYNVATFADQLDEYDWLYLSPTANYVDPTPAQIAAGTIEGQPGTPAVGQPRRGGCAANADTTCFTTPVTKAQFIERESAGVLTHMLGNDPRPHYAHQPNVILDPANASVSNRGDGILYDVIGPAIDKYKAYFNTPLQQPGMTALREELRRQAAWTATTNAQVNGYIQDGKVTIVSTGAHEVPITGTATVGSMYGGRRSGWLTVAAGATTTVLDLEEPRNTVAPVITGTTKVGDVLTATDGTYTGSPVLTFTSRQWQRRAGAVGITPAGPWTAIVRPVPDPTPNAYTLTAADVGQELRFVTTVSNPIATWGMGLSAPLLIPSAAVNDTATVLEDAAATPIPVLTNDTHPVGGVIRLTVTQPAHGTAAVIPGSTGTPATNDGVSYKPNANYCNAPGAAATDNFAYTVNGGATATVAMTVTCVDDSPVAVDDAATVGRDSGATSIGVLANDTDVDGGTLQVASATQAPHGTVAITGGGSGLSYAPSAGYCGAVDTFTYKVNGGSQATVSVTVTCPETARVDAPATLTEATSPPAATSAPAATAKPSSIVPFTCRIARGKMVTLSCKVTDKSGKLKTATIRATRGTRTVGRASGKVKLGNTVPTLRIKRGVRQVNTKITITVKLANGKFRVLTRTLKV